jgi:hypothetical protein
MSTLCREFGISRKTGYKLYRRYRDIGLEGLTDRSRRPYRQANKLPFQVESRIVQLRKEHPSWGAPKIREKLRRLDLGVQNPAISTVFAGQTVGVKQVADQVWLVSFMHYDFGFLDNECCRMEAAQNPFGVKVLRVPPEYTVTHVSGMDHLKVAARDGQIRRERIWTCAACPQGEGHRRPESINHRHADFQSVLRT